MDLSEVKICLLRPSEYSRWFSLMQAHHYLGISKRIAGKRLFYVATDGAGEWLALIGWCAAALHLKDRDEWIGWSDSVRKLRLDFVANNFRFLILPGKSSKNLASKILSANLRTLSQDWQCAYSHPIYLAETFVDSSRYYGGCYRASNWILVGETKGFRRTSTSELNYVRHGIKKLIFVKPLCSRSQALLCDPQMNIKKEHYRHKEEVLVIDVNRLPISGQGGLVDSLKRVEDPRRRQGQRHTQVSVLAMSACALLSGARGFKGIHQWASNLSVHQRGRFRCRDNKIPSRETFRRVLIGLDSEKFDSQINDWLLKVVAGGKIRGLAVDGKTLRGSKDGKKKTTHLLSALVHEEKVTVAQTNVGKKKNEISCFIPLIEKLDLNGGVVTADAMHCQTNHAEFIVQDKKSDYAFVVKNNQKNLLKNIQNLLEANAEFATLHKRTSSGHGRIDSRVIQLLELQPLDKYSVSFPYATHVFRIERTSTNKNSNETTLHQKYGITSLSSSKINAEGMLEIMLSHWNIESTHWIRDEIFFEDRSRIRTGSGPQVMAALRNAAIGIMRYSGAKNISEAVEELKWSGPKRPMRAIGITS